MKRTWPFRPWPYSPSSPRSRSICCSTTRAWCSSVRPASVGRTPCAWRVSSGVPSASSMPRTRWLAEASVMCERCAPAGQAAGFDDVEKEPQVGEIESHGGRKVARQPQSAPEAGCANAAFPAAPAPGRLRGDDDLFQRTGEPLGRGRRGLPAGRRDQGRDRAGAADGVDGAACAVDAAGARGGAADRAVAGHQHLADRAARHVHAGAAAHRRHAGRDRGGNAGRRAVAGRAGGRLGLGGTGCGAGGLCALGAHGAATACAAPAHERWLGPLVGAARGW
jgi:hypothetical protein